MAKNNIITNNVVNGPGFSFVEVITNLDLKQEVDNSLRTHILQQWAEDPHATIFDIYKIKCNDSTYAHLYVDIEEVEAPKRDLNSNVSFLSLSSQRYTVEGKRCPIDKIARGIKFVNKSIGSEESIEFQATRV